MYNREKGLRPRVALCAGKCRRRRETLSLSYAKNSPTPTIAGNHMGIRTTCPNGHKLNVKAFLAGLRGICPHCGASFTIPTESTRPSSKARNGDSRESQAQTADLATDVEAEIEISTGVPEPRAAASHPVSPGPVKRPPPLPAGDTGDTYPLRSTPAEAASRSATNHSAARPSSEFLSRTSPLSAASSSARDVSGASPAERVPSRAVSSSPAAGFGFSSPDSNPATAPEPPAVISPAPQKPDPLAEAPNAVWYVRPASGGQFGPATNEIMRAWLKEGRIGPDSLVWREGWRDWKEASDTFPQFSTDSGNLAGVLANVESMPLHPTTTHPAPTRRRMDGAGILLICVLFVVVIVLVAVLCWVLLRQSSAAPVSTVGNPSSATAALDGPASPCSERLL